MLLSEELKMKSNYFVSHEKYEAFWQAFDSKNQKEYRKLYKLCYRGIKDFCFEQVQEEDLADNIAAHAIIQLLEKKDISTIRQIDTWMAHEVKKLCVYHPEDVDTVLGHRVTDEFNEAFYRK